MVARSFMGFFISRNSKISQKESFNDKKSCFLFGL